MTPEELTKWINSLYRQKQIHRFYIWSEWLRVRAEVLEEQKNECQRHKVMGKYRHADTVHHKKYLRTHPHLALTKSNLEAICAECHYVEHHAKRQLLNLERW